MKKIFLPILTIIIILNILTLPLYNSTTPISSTTNDNLTLVVSAKSSNTKTKASTTKKKAATQKKEKYPEARKVWNYLKKLGYNDYVAAGIMGNLMTETGGNTLNIKPNAYGSNKKYYGICQWSKKYYPKVQGKNLDYQLSFLKNTIKNEFNTYGYKYAKGFNYKSFLKLKDSKKAALAFAKVYERCGSGSYSKRQANAVTAYKYFVK